MRTTALVLLLSVVAVGTALLPGARPAAANPLMGIVAIAAGGLNTCALTIEGGVKCWGDNDFGTVGDGTTVQRSTPAGVSGLDSGVAAVSTGGAIGGVGHTCAVTTSAGLKCWGANGRGQLGVPEDEIEACPPGAISESSCSTLPISVPGVDSGIAAIATAFERTCAVTTQGGVRCWGENWAGHLGDGTTIDRGAPVDVCQIYDSEAEECLEPLTGVADVALGSNRTCAIMADGSVKCWGDNTGGALGAPSEESCLHPFNVLVPCSTTPAEVCQRFDNATEVCIDPLVDIRSVSMAGSSACGVTKNGHVKCWGANGLGQLGDGQACGDLICGTPVNVCADRACATPLSGIAAVSVGRFHTCVLGNDGSVKCWGANFFGSLGDGTETDSTTPVDVVGLPSEVMSIATGAGHVCVLTLLGAVQCWGANCCGNLGIGTSDFDPHPTPLDVLAQAGKPAGDADCSGEVTSQDALLVLQLDAALIAALTCPVPMDLNGDGYVDSIDAVLILQHVAGLIPGVLQTRR